MRTTANDESATTDVPDAPPPAHGAAPAAKSLGSRRFVVLFAVYTLVPLVAYQYALSTTAMDWYLFQVARHTAWILGKIGHSGSVENPALFAGREAEVRAVLAGLPPGTASSGAATAPLNTWEVWRYRILQMDQSMDQARAALMALDQAPALENESNPGLLQKLDDRITFLNNFVRADEAQHALVSLAQAPGIQEALANIKMRLASCKANSSGDERQKSQVLRDLVQSVDEFRTAQIAYLRTALSRAHVQYLRERPPLVTFVYDPGSTGGPEPNRLPESPEMKAHRDTAQNPVTVSSAANGTDPPRKPISFRFRVAPECSAIPSMIIYLGAIFAFPACWWARVLGAVGGLPVLYLVNVLRLACLATIGAFTEGGPWFKFSHEYIWQGIYVIFVVAVWMAWVEYIVRRRAAA